MSLSWGRRRSLASGMLWASTWEEISSWPHAKKGGTKEGSAVAPVARSELCRLRTLGSHGALNRLGDGS